MTDLAADVTFPAGTIEPEYDLREPLDPDEGELFTTIPSDDRAYWMRARALVQDEVLPVIDDYWDRADYPTQFIRRIGELDLMRDGLAVDGYPEQSKLAAGLVGMELTRGDGSVAAMMGVQGALAMRSIALLGSPEQKAEWLPQLAAGTTFGAFALTEPAHGSDSTSLETRATSVDGGVRIDGTKKWIGNGSVGGVTVVWARGDDGEVHGYVVPQDTPGYVGTTITQKMALRAIWQAHIRLDDVRVPDSAMLPHSQSFRDTSRALVTTRLGVAWSTVGHAVACYESAVHYAKQRVQFGRPLAKSQIIQERLARMLAELTQIQLMVVRMTELDVEDRLTGEKASLAKFTATRAARSIAANARDLLGGNGLLLKNRVARHFADMETAHTYEGTETIQALIIGRGILGTSAFR